MATIDLSSPQPVTGGLLDALPRRLTLTLPELRLVAQAAGEAPLPFELIEGDAPKAGLEGRLGRARGSLEADAYAAALASLRDPAATLAKRGLLVENSVDGALLGAVGLLATPEVALDLDVAVPASSGEPGCRVRAWHRQSGGAVATLATGDGIVFELAWFRLRHWPDELGRVAVLPEGLGSEKSAVPRIDLPYELLDAAAEAISSNRPDLLPVLARELTGTLLREDDLVRILRALSEESQGRLRAMVARVAPRSTSGSSSTTTGPTPTGVVSWTLLADGWRALHPHEQDGTLWVDVRPVQPGDLATDLAPAISELSR